MKLSHARDFSLTKNHYRKFIGKPRKTNFDNYVKLKFVLWVLRMHKDVNATNWLAKNIDCDCPSFQKNLAVLQKINSDKKI